MADSGRHQVVLDLAIESLGKSGKLRFRAQGTSMLPTIRPGTYVAVRSAAPDQIVTGDIILAKTSAGFRLHRVVDIRYESAMAVFITRGDNHRHNDRPITAAELVGKWERSLPEPRCTTRFLHRRLFSIRRAWSRWIAA
jgi:signal peptidase I